MQIYLCLRLLNFCARFLSALMNWTWQDTFDVMSVIWLTDYCCMALYLTIQYVTNIITQCRWRCTRLKYTFTAIKELLQPCSKLLGANAIAIVEIMHFPYFSHGTVSTSWIRVLWQSTLLGEEGAAAPLLQPVHSQVFLLGEVDYELALSVSPCGDFLKTTDLYYRHLFSFQKFEISLNP